MLAHPLDIKVKYVALFSMFLGCIGSLYSVGDKVFGANDSFSPNGEISSLIFGMPQSANTVNMSSTEKFILSGYWKLVTDKGKISMSKDLQA